MGKKIEMNGKPMAMHSNEELNNLLHSDNKKKAHKARMELEKRNG